MLRKITAALCLLPGLCLALASTSDPLLRLEGTYLAYSYDHNQVFGHEVRFLFAGYEVFARRVRVDLVSRSFDALGEVRLKKEGEVLAGDELLFRPDEGRGVLVTYGEKIETVEVGSPGGGILLPRGEVLDGIMLPKILRSFIYFTGRRIEITSGFDVYGFDVTFYLEGLESVGFRKLKLSEGIEPGGTGLSIDKIWFNRNQGFIGRLSYAYDREGPVQSLTQIDYEERSVIKDYSGAPRRVDIATRTSWDMGRRFNLELSGNYDSSDLWNVDVSLAKEWTPGNETRLQFSYNKPIELRGEAWLGMETALGSDRWGRLTFSGKYEVHDQVLTRFAYERGLWENMDMMINGSYSKVLIGEGLSEILTGGVDLSYRTQVFDISANYSLNHDLFGSQLLSQPQLRFGLHPFLFYGGLLTAEVANVFIYNWMRTDSGRGEAYSNNTMFNLSTGFFSLWRGLVLDFKVGVEQFLEKQGRHFSSGGLIFNGRQKIFNGLWLEGFYSFQSRRLTRNWLVEGTSSEDLSAVLRVNPSDGFNGWLSLSYDPKRDEWRQSFADVEFRVFKNWKFHSQLNYDFQMKKINNVDLYLIRESGRFLIRLIWRSLSKQLLVELVPR